MFVPIIRFVPIDGVWEELHASSKSKESQAFAGINAENRPSVKAAQDGNGLLDRPLSRANHEERQYSRHETDCNCREWCVSVVSPPHGFLDEVE